MFFLNIKYLIFIVVVFFSVYTPKTGLAGPLVQQASVAGLAPQGSFPGLPYLGKDYSFCGQRCLYSKAAENVMIQADFLLFKMAVLKEIQKDIEKKDLEIQNLIQQNPPGLSNKALLDLNSQKDTLIRRRDATLGTFCMKTEHGNKTSSCYERYMRTHGLVLYSMRHAMTVNQDRATQLTDNRPISFNTLGTPQKRPKFLIPRSDNPQEKSILPYVPTYEELQAVYGQMQSDRASQKLQPYTEKDYLNWLKDFEKFPDLGVDTRHPERQLFVQSAELDVGDSGGQKHWALIRGFNNQIQFDKKDYERAKNNYKNDYDKKSAQLSKMENDVLAMKGKDEVERVVSAMNQHQTLPDQVDPNGQPTSEDVTHFIYNQSRGFTVDDVNRQVLGLRQVVSFQKNVQNVQTTQSSAQAGALPFPVLYKGNEKVKEMRVKDFNQKNRLGELWFSIPPDYYMDEIDKVIAAP